MATWTGRVGMMERGGPPWENVGLMVGGREGAVVRLGAPVVCEPRWGSEAGAGMRVEGEKRLRFGYTCHVLPSLSFLTL